MFALVCSFQLGQKISKEINPQSTKPSDVKVMKTLVPLVEKGTDLLKKYNESGNATIDYINITDSLGELGRQWGMSNRGASPPPFPGKTKRLTERRARALLRRICTPLLVDCLLYTTYRPLVSSTSPPPRLPLKLRPRFGPE